MTTLTQNVPVSFHAFLDTSDFSQLVAAGCDLPHIQNALNDALNPLGATRVVAEVTERHGADDTVNLTVNMTPVRDLNTDIDSLGAVIQNAVNQYATNAHHRYWCGPHVENGSIRGALLSGFSLGTAAVSSAALVYAGGYDSGRRYLTGSGFRVMVVDETTVQPGQRTTPPPVSSSAAGQALSAHLGNARVRSADAGRDNNPVATVSPEDGPSWYVVAGLIAGGVLITGLAVAYIVRSFK